jgi:hypothetical protein
MDAIEALIAVPLQPLPSRWHVPRQAALLAEARAAENRGGFCAKRRKPEPCAAIPRD